MLFQLKTELRCEIVRDVTRKTVREVLKGLDGAVIESLQGSNLLPTASTDSNKGKTPKTEYRKLGGGLLCFGVYPLSVPVQARGYKTFFMLNSTEHKILTARKR